MNNQRQNGGGSRPVAIPGSSDNDRSFHQLAEDAPLMSSPRALQTSPTKLLASFGAACRPANSNWADDAFLSSSPMVTAPRNLRLPDLDLREARRAAAAAANLLPPISASAEFVTNERERRDRSRSLGSSPSKDSYNALEDSAHSSPLLLGEKLLRRKTPSGLSLLDLEGRAGFEDDERDDIGECDNYPEGYETTTASYTKPLAEEEAEARPISTSQSCTIHDLNPTPPSPPMPRRTMSTKNSLLEELRAEFASQSNPPILSLLYALVNLSIVLPVLMSFGSIIYHDDFFRPYLSVLMKLTVVSGAVHQITFSTVSSLPFAVGQVQDAGLIFLSAMARDLVSQLKAMGADDDSILATVTIGLSLYTAVLGCALIAVGRFSLASYCQLLPSSVVGGYLAYIGFFCGQAGMALMASVDVTGLAQWYRFFDPSALVLLAPGVLGGCMIYYSVRTFRHMATLPTCIIMLMVVFYGILWATGTSVGEATNNGWIMETADSPAWNHTWDFLRIEKVVWSVLPSQTLTVLAMISVVALSSSLDIAAIEIELKRPLDYNHELKTVGISNIISGLTGGYTGSYIFSQTIFSLRMGIRSRLMGYVLAVLSLVAVVVPVNILAYIPNFFFGSLLMMICLDLMFEWLIDVREKVTQSEYVVLISTFALLQVLGVEFGIIGGVVLYVIIQRMGYDVGRDRKLNEDGITEPNE
ncbi:hypothetical protein ACHAXT_011220 [Thalassiosira profunda]